MRLYFDKTVRYILILGFSLTINCSPLSAQVNYINYHKDIIKAEDLFLNGQVKKSIAAYKSIFKKYDKPFAKDCYVALQLACWISDTTDASYFFKESFEHGVNWNAIKHSRHIMNILSNNNKYKNEVSNLYTIYYPKYWQSLNLPLRHAIINLLDSDGENKKNYVFKAVHNRYIDILDNNIQTLAKITEKYGIPGEHMVGLMDTDLIGYETTYAWRLRSLPSLIFFHHRCGYPLMKTALMEAVKNGEIEPHEYALIYSWSYAQIREYKGHYTSNVNNMNFKTQCEFDTDVKYYNFSLDNLFYCNDTALVNEDRNAIGMASLQHDSSKEKFAKENDLILFFGMLESY